MSDILLVEATEEMQTVAADLERAGFRVVACSEEVARERLVAGELFGALLANLMDERGEAALRKLTESVRAPAHHATLAIVRLDQLSELDPGLPIDDFIVFPTTSEELIARVRLCIQKRDDGEDANLLRCGDLTIDKASYKVFVGGRAIDLTFKEYELLHFLAKNQDKVCTRETLLNQVWGYEFYGGARTVDVHIRRVRSKIEDANHSLIETVRNVGYRLRAG